MMEEIMEAMESEHKKIRWSTVFVLFMVGSLLGVLIEGLWYAFDHGGWETHVVTIWGPFLIVYGFGMAGCYIGSVLMRKRKWWERFAVFSLIGAAVEFISGWSILKAFGMRAWDYGGKFLDIMGLTDLNMALVWGFIGTVFAHAVPYIDNFMSWFEGGFWKFLITAGTVFMAVDILWTAAVIGRWSARHWGNCSESTISSKIDELYPDEYMQERYVEWWFSDENGQYDHERKHCTLSNTAW